MKKVQILSKYPAFLVSLLLVLQSCGVYYKTPVSLDEAVSNGDKVKILNTAGKQIKYKKVVQDEGQFYGLNKKGGEWVRVPILADDINTVRLKNKKASTWVTVLAVGVPITALVILVATADFGIGGISWGGGY